MKKRKNNFTKVLIKISLFLLAIVMAGSAFLSSTGTHSWFVSKAGAAGNIDTASASDILAECYIEKAEYKGSSYPESIVLKKAEGISEFPVIYFSVSGEAAQYVLHINPVKLDSFSEIKVPIVPGVNPDKYKDLKGRNDDIKGTITVQYFNGFISQPFEISYPADYLKHVVSKAAQNQGQQTPNRISPAEGIQSESMDAEEQAQLSGVIEGIAGIGFWEAVQIPDGNTGYIQPAALSQDQKNIIDIIAPNLRAFIDNMIRRFNTLADEIEAKDSEIEKLQDANFQLSKQNADLESSVNKLSQENEDLKQKLDSIQARNNDADTLK